MKKSNIVPLRPVKELVLSLDQLTGFDGVKTLAKLLQQEIRSGVLLKDIARKANLQRNTVAKIISRDTKAPRMLTCIMLFKALGFKAVRLD